MDHRFRRVLSLCALAFTACRPETCTPEKPMPEPALDAGAADTPAADMPAADDGTGGGSPDPDEGRCPWCSPT